MPNLNFSIHIAAPREKVWDMMLDDKTYREWTYEFYPGSYYEGSWDQGADIKFLSPGMEGGMAAKIKENRLHEYISIEHHGEIKDGVESSWEGATAYENYTLIDKDGGTEVIVEMTNVPENYTEMMNDLWPKALKRLKEISEK